MNLITIIEAAKLFPTRNGKHPAAKTVRRWIKEGVKGVKLKGSRVGGFFYTTPEWVKEFEDRCSGRKPEVSSRERKERNQRAREILISRWGYVPRDQAAGRKAKATVGSE